MFVELVDNDDVLKAVRVRGPVLPMEIRKYLGKGDSITIGAALSTLLSKGHVKSTKVRLGGSPFYYAPGQEEKLEFLSKHLNDKDNRVFEELRSRKIIKDSVQEPIVRVALRNIPDFAKQLIISQAGESVLYWRWYLLSEEEALVLLENKSKPKEESPQTAELHKSLIETESEESVDEIKSDSLKEVAVEDGFIIADDGKGVDLENKGSKVADLENKRLENINRFKEESELKISKDKELEDKEVKEGKESKLVKNSKDSKELKELKDLKENKEIKDFKDSKSVSSIKKVKEEELQKELSEEINIDEEFFSEIKKFFVANKVIVKEAVVVRKNKDYELIISSPTPFGKIDFFCRAKAKKRCDEGDLSSAILQGQNKRLPVVFLTNGELTKKSREKLFTDFKGLLVKEI